MKFRNSLNNYTEDDSSKLSWLFCLLFGPLYFLARGNVRQFGLLLILVPITCGIAWLVTPFFVYRINEKDYLYRGWTKVE